VCLNEPLDERFTISALGLLQQHERSPHGLP
jgi:hypothetical protein